MRKQFPLFSIIVPTLLLGAFSFLKLEKNNTYQQVKADAVLADGLYFIKNGSDALTKTDLNKTKMVTDSDVDTPFTLQHVSGDTYYIMQDGYYLCGDYGTAGVNLDFRTSLPGSGEITNTIKIEVNGSGKYQMSTYYDSTHYKYVKVTSSALRTTSTDNTQYIFDFVPVSSFITGMATVPCAGESDTEAKREAWDDLKKSLDVTVKNYLKNIPADIDADVDTLAGALAKYDYIVVKYNDSTNYPDFLERDPDPSAYGFMYIPSSSNSSSSDIYMITSLSILIGVSIITSLSMYLTIKKKHK